MHRHTTQGGTRVKLADCSIVLTGASGGIGAATARALVAAGARVLLVARDGARLAKLADALSHRARDGQAAAFAADLATARGRVQLRDLAIARRVNVLINNAGTPCFGALGETDDARIAEVITTNLVAPMALTRALLPHLAAQPRAIVLNVGSTLGRLALPGFSVYSASKFGLRGFTEALRRELDGSRIGVLYLAPRSTKTAFNDDRVTAFNRATGTREDPPEAVAAAIVRMIERGTPERQLGFPERFAVHVNGLVPRWLDGAFAKHRAELARPAALPPLSKEIAR
jgi:short-subunit dehydrogenase